LVARENISQIGLGKEIQNKKKTTFPVDSSLTGLVTLGKKKRLRGGHRSNREGSSAWEEVRKGREISEGV